MSRKQKYILNKVTLLWEPYRDTRWLNAFKTAFLYGGSLLCACLCLFLYSYVGKNELPKTAVLRSRNDAWVARMAVLDNELDKYEDALYGIEVRDDKVYRSIYGLKEIPAEVKNSGIGGQTRYAFLEGIAPNSFLRLNEVRLDHLSKRAFIQSKSLDEMYSLATTMGDMLSCIPAVPPLCPTPRVYLSSSFGYRTDPVYGGGAFHKGQDFATQSGTPVYATGDGVVRSVRYTSNGYGNEILINHGFGYVTRYAHLSSTAVTEGMKVRRGDYIGAVGSTGKSTGPHLHYEVLYMDSQVNPMRFMDYSISEEEFNAMVRQREDESISRKHTTSELIMRGKRR